MDQVKIISIALATYNGEKYLREQLESVLNQSCKDFELIVCDDCSSDNTLDLLHEYAQKDSRIKIFQNEVNLGFKKNFEKILSLCSGEYIAFCDQDDIWHPDHLETLLNNIGDYDYIGANSLIIDENGISQNKTLLEYWPVHRMPKDKDELFQHELYSNVIQGTASLVKASLLKTALPFPENVRYHDYWLALNAGINNGCKYISTVILDYRRHSNNASAYQKFSLFNAIRDLYHFSKDKKSFYKESILLLENISQKNMSNVQRSQLNKALTFHKNLSDEKNKLSSLCHYIKNYNTITLSYKRILPLFFYRIFSIVVFGIKG